MAARTGQENYLPSNVQVPKASQEFEGRCLRTARINRSGEGERGCVPLWVVDDVILNGAIGNIHHVHDGVL